MQQTSRVGVNHHGRRLLAFALGAPSRVLSNSFTPTSLLVTKFVTKIFFALCSEKCICHHCARSLSYTYFEERAWNSLPSLARSALLDQDDPWSYIGAWSRDRGGRGYRSSSCPLEGIALPGYRWDSISYRGLMGHYAWGKRGKGCAKSGQKTFEEVEERREVILR